MRKLEVRLTRSPGDSPLVGMLAEDSRRIYFEFDPAFVETGLELSPFRLPLVRGLVEHTDLRFGPLPGLFDDSLPDGWGLMLMDRRFRANGLEPPAVSPLDRLAFLGTRTMGALTYHPPMDVERDAGSLDLAALARNAEEILAGEAVEVLPALLSAGGSPGGARPKVVVGIRGDEVRSGEEDLPEGWEHWIVKFAAREDARDAGPVEFAYAWMAREAEIAVPEVRLFEASRARRWFGARRFDRLPGNRRIHVHTFGNLIHSNFRIPSTDYADLLGVTRTLTRDQRDVEEVFRRMAFNVAAHNRDDHAKNFAFRMDDSGEWSLAPAYDLTFAAGPGGEHTMTVGGEGRRPGREHCLALAGRFGIRHAAAVGILDAVSAAVGRWPEFARQAGCTKAATARIGAAIRPL